MGQYPQIIPVDSDDTDDIPVLSEYKPKQGFLSKAWTALNTPMVDVSPTTRQAMGEFTKEHPYLGRVGEFATDTMLAGSSALGLGLEAATAGTALPAIAGRSTLAKALKTPGRVVAGATAAHGAYKTGKGLYEGNYPEAFAGALETGVGGLGYMSHGKGPLEITKPLPNVEPIAKPIVQPEVKPYGPELPPVEELNIQNRLRDPKYPPADSFDAGIVQAPDVVPNIPRGIKLNSEQKAKADFAKDSADVAPKIETPSITNKIVSKLGEEKGAIGPDVSKGPNTVEELRRAKSQERINSSQAKLDELDKAGAPDDQYQNVLSEGLRFKPEGRSWRDQVVRFIETEKRLAGPTPKPEAKSVITRRTPAEDLKADAETQSLAARYNQGRKAGTISPDVNFYQWSRNAPKIEPEPIGQPIAQPQPIVEPLSNIEPLRAKNVGELQPTTLPQDISQATAPIPDVEEPVINRHDRRSGVTGKFIAKVKEGLPPDDAFERGELQPKPGGFTHDSFLDSMKEVLSREAKKIITNEKGNVILPNLNPFPGKSNVSVQNALREWAGAREAAQLPIGNKPPSDYAIKTQRSAADKTLRNYLDSIGVKNIQKRNLSSPAVWREIGVVDAKAGKMMKRYFSEPTEGLHEIAGGVSGTKNLALTGGIPGRTGQVSAHALNILRSDVQARGVKKAVQNWGEGSIDPKVKIEYIKAHQPELRKLVNEGMTWTNIEGHSTLGPIETKIDKIPYLGEANKYRRNVFEKPLFEIHLPATKLKMGIEKAAELMAKGKSEKEAYKYAAQWANDFSGSVNTQFRNKTWNDVWSILALAPHWTESRFTVARKGILPKSMGGVEGYGAPAIRGAAMAAPAVLARIAAAGGIANYLLNSKPAESTSIPAGETSLKKRNIDPLGTAVEPTRLLIQSLTQERQGKPGFPFEYIGNKKSMPLQMMENLTRNIDPFENSLWGKDRFGKPIPASTAALNIGQELTRPITMSFVQSLVDASRGKATPEEALAKALELPISYTYKDKPKKSGSHGLRSLK